MVESWRWCIFGSQAACSRLPNIDSLWPFIMPFSILRRLILWRWRVLSHKNDCQFRPVAFASSTLTQAQQNYSQLEEEAFSIIFGLKWFQQYLYGRLFTILTGHRPLLTLFGPQKPVPTHSVARLQRWALILASYNYRIEHRRTGAHADADSLSRLPLPQTWSPKCENKCCFLDTEVVTSITSQLIKKETQWIQSCLKCTSTSLVAGRA